MNDDMAPGGETWQRHVTASKVPAILSVSPYASPYSVWCEMKGITARDPKQTDVMSRGDYLEDAIRTWWRDNHKPVWFRRQVRRHIDDWGFATLDTLVRERDGTLAIVEIKTTTKREHWGEPNTDQIPDYVMAQILWQFACTPNARRAYVAVLFTGLTFAEYVIERDPRLAEITALVNICRDFYLSLANDMPPELDNHVATVTALQHQNPNITKGEIAFITDDLARDWVAAAALKDEAEATLTGCKAKVLQTVGNAQFISTISGIRVARRQAKGDGLPYPVLLKQHTKQLEKIDGITARAANGVRESARG